MTRKRFSIRPLRVNEVNLLPKLWTDAGLPFRPRGRDSPDRLAKQRKATPDLFVGAFMQGRLVGTAIASDDGRKGWINRLAVLPEVRRLGVGKALARECEKALRRRGHRLFCVLVEDDNLESAEFFKSIGYRRELDIVYYTKRLDDSY